MRHKYQSDFVGPFTDLWATSWKECVVFLCHVQIIYVSFNPTKVRGNVVGIEMILPVPFSRT